MNNIWTICTFLITMLAVFQHARGQGKFADKGKFGDSSSSNAASMGGWINSNTKFNQMFPGGRRVNRPSGPRPITGGGSIVYRPGPDYVGNDAKKPKSSENEEGLSLSSKLVIALFVFLFVGLAAGFIIRFCYWKQIKTYLKKKKEKKESNKTKTKAEKMDNDLYSSVDDKSIVISNNNNNEKDMIQTRPGFTEPSRVVPPPPMPRNQSLPNFYSSHEDPHETHKKRYLPQTRHNNENNFTPISRPISRHGSVSRGQGRSRKNGHQHLNGQVEGHQQKHNHVENQHFNTNCNVVVPRQYDRNSGGGNSDFNGRGQPEFTQRSGEGQVNFAIQFPPRRSSTRSAGFNRATSSFHGSRRGHNGTTRSASPISPPARTTSYAGRPCSRAVSHVHANTLGRNFQMINQRTHNEQILF